MAYNDPRQVCAPWVVEADLCCDADETVVDCETGVASPATHKWTNDQLILAASNILYARTCFKYPGVCTRTTHPCITCSCQGHPCHCGVYRFIDLREEHPVLSIDEINIDGATLVNTAYRIDDFERVVRIDGEFWPCCNSLGVPDTNEVELFVTYKFGVNPPIELQIAAAELTCQLKRACEGQPCELPDNVRDRLKSFNRRGSNIQIQSISELLGKGLLGNDLIDQALAVHGNCGGTTTGIDPTRHRRARRVQVNTSGP